MDSFVVFDTENYQAASANKDRQRAFELASFTLSHIMYMTTTNDGSSIYPD